MKLWSFQTRAWKILVPGPGSPHNPAWTKDSAWLYYGCAGRGGDAGLDAIYRVRIPDGSAGIALESWKFHREDTSHSTFSGLAPDGSVLLMQFTHDFDVSTLDLRLPR